ncbi:GNAT family N-acetyltransferase [Actinoplanes italicus]|nr:GNAT family N-acetyltransferase [Actinoplanes italicus]
MTAGYERTEASMLLALTDATDPALARRYDMDAATIGEVVVTSRPGPDMAFWCQAVGFEAPPTAGLIEEIVAHFRARDVEVARFVLPAYAETPEWPAIAEKHGLTAGETGLKLAMRAPLPYFTPHTDLRTARIAPDERERWATLMWGVFDMEFEANIAVTVSALDDPAFEAYACWDGDEMVATGLVWLGPDSAHLSSGATLASHRRRGAQQALLAARVEAARRAGCSLVVNESGVAAEGYNDSARNQIRVGFTPQYSRRTWTWTAEA